MGYTLLKMEGFGCFPWLFPTSATTERFTFPPLRASHGTQPPGAWPRELAAQRQEVRVGWVGTVPPKSSIYKNIGVFPF